MKVFAIILNSLTFIAVAVLTSLFFYFNLPILRLCAAITLVATIVFNAIYCLVKRKGNKFNIFSLIVGALLLITGEMLVKKYLVAGMLLISAGFAGNLIYIILQNRFKWTDLWYVFAIVVGMLMLVFSHIFNLDGEKTYLLVTYFAVVLSAVFGFAVANMFKRQTSENIFCVIGAFFLLVSGICLLFNLFTVKPDAIKYISTIGLYVAQMFFCFASIFAYNNKNKATGLIRENIKEKKRSMVFKVVTVLILSVLSCYSLVVSSDKFNMVNASITKTQFLEMIDRKLNVPLIEINTEDAVEPYSKEEYVNCSFKISNCNDEKHNFAVEMETKDDGDFNVGIRLRGNSTKWNRKKPYRIKFDEKTEMLGLKKNKSWVLLADFFDQSYVRNYTAMQIANGFINTTTDEGMDFAPTGNHVAVVINGQFKGLYLLCEQMDENKGRANVKADLEEIAETNPNFEGITDFPFLVEMDRAALKEGITGVDNFAVEGFFPVEIKYPEADERGNDKIVYNYIYEYINAVFKTLRTGEKVSVSFRENPVGLTDLVDIDSVAEYYLVNEIMLNADNFYGSIYLHKAMEGENGEPAKMKFGPIWDFDFSMANEFNLPYEESYIESASSLYLAYTSPIYRNLFKNETFYNAVVKLYDENVRKTNLLVNLSNHLRTYKATIDNVARIDAKMTHGETGLFQFDMQYDYVRLYLLDRNNYLNDVFSLTQTHTEFLDNYNLG